MGDNCGKILIISQSLKPFIKKSIESDFYLGCEFIKVALAAAIKNLEVNSNFFELNSKAKIAYLKGYLARWKTEKPLVIGNKTEDKG